MQRSLIGTGTIGQSLQQHMQFDAVYNSHNLNLSANIDLLVVAAPSGNRLAVNRGELPDRDNIQQLTRAIQQAQPAHTVLISTVDAVVAPDSEYGRNRAWMEQQLQQSNTVSVLRLSTLIGATIKKNMLYDLKHGVFLQHIDPGAVLQWCLLADLPRLILAARPGTTQNIVSEPIANWEILQRFFPELAQQKYSAVCYDQRPYTYTRQRIFQAMEQYLQ